MSIPCLLRLFVLPLLILPIVLQAQPQETEASEETVLPEAIRSVLDGRARMVTFPGEDLWLAYDAAQCDLYKAWDGDVKFDGAVYTYAHGPQPTSQGVPYWLGDDQPSWQLVGPNGIQTITPTFGGYGQSDAGLTMHYYLKQADGSRTHIVEIPSVEKAADGTIHLKREFMVAQSAPGVYPRLLLRGHQFGQMTEITATRPISEAATEGRSQPWGNMTAVEGYVDITGATTLTYTFTPYTLNRLSAGKSIANFPNVGTRLANTAQGEGVTVTQSVFFNPSANRWVPMGLAGSSMGPVNLKFFEGEARDEQTALKGVVLEQLLNNVTGWVGMEIEVGDTPLSVYELGRMQAPGNLGRHTLKIVRKSDGLDVVAAQVTMNPEYTPGTFTYVELDEMVTLDANTAYYVVSEEAFGGDTWYAPGLAGPPRQVVRPAQTEPENEAAGMTVSTFTIDVDGTETIVQQGLATRIYDIGSSMSRLFKLVPGQTPNASFVKSDGGFWDPTHFAGYTENFIAHLTGYINIPEDGDYQFLMWANDGASLTIGDQEVVPADQERGQMTLTAGYHPWKIEMYQSGGEASVGWQWLRPGTEDFEWVPWDVFATESGEVRVTSPGQKQILGLATQTIPGHGVPLTDVHPSYDLMTIRPEGFEPRVGGIDFTSDARLAVSTWDADGAVYLLDNVQGDDRDAISVKKIAEGLAEPLGLKVVDDAIYIMQKQELTRLVDSDGDDVIDDYQTVADGWGVTANFHEFGFGLVHKDDHFYATLAIAIDPGGASTTQQSPDRGRVVKIAEDGTYEFIGRGLRTPNGIGIGVDGELFVADNQGDWLPSSKILHVKEGAFFGNRSVASELTAELEEQPPVVWLPQGEIGNSPSTPVLLSDGPYAGQMIHGEVTHGGIKRVFVEEVDGAYQGAVFRFTQGLESGVNRLVWGPDGALYIGGIGAPGNWGHAGKNWFGLQRMKYNGNPTFEMLAVRAMTNGVELEFTEPLVENAGFDPEGYIVRQWYYLPTQDYGGPKLDETQLRVASASVSEDRRRVFLEVEGIKPGHVVFLQIVDDLRSNTNQRLWATDAWYTMNAIPADRYGVVDTTQVVMHNTLTPEEAVAGWELLFDGSTFANFRGYKSETVPTGWSVTENGEIHFDGEGRGDLVTDASFGDFELKLEWKISEGGNSGIFFRGSEEFGNIWETAPEMQVLDNQRHYDGGNALTSAGANYALHAPPHDATRKVGLYNKVHIIASGPYVEYWLNGVQTATYEIGSAEWTALVAGSKFNTMPNYGSRAEGLIALQDHGDKVWYRNIKIRRLNNR